MATTRETTMVELVCQLSEQEIQDRAYDAGQTDQQIMAREADFEVARKEHKGEIELLLNRRRDLLREIRERQTRRDVECIVERIYSPEFVVRMTRTDTGEIVRERPMSMDERQGQLLELEKRNQVN